MLAVMFATLILLYDQSVLMNGADRFGNYGKKAVRIRTASPAQGIGRVSFP
jgi:hypothetical protein